MPVLSRPYRSQRNRRRATKGQMPMALSLVASAIEFTTPNILLTFDVPVVLAGIPQWLTDTGKLPVSAARPTPNTVLMLYNTPGSVTTVTVPENDPALRSATGGYATPGTFPAT